MWQYHCHELLGEMFYGSLIISSQYNLGEQNFSLYLTGVKMKYWDNPILLGNGRSIGELLEHIFFSAVDSLLGKGRRLEML